MLLGCRCRAVAYAGPELFFSRVRERRVADILVPVASAEDVVTMKVLAGRSKDLEDAAAIARAHGDALDLEQIQATLRTLEKALDRADLVGELDRVLARISARTR